MKTIPTAVLLSALLLTLTFPAFAAMPDFFNVRDYGAVGDGKTLDSPAIDKAIAAAADAGGGTVLVPAGTYLSGSIHLKSNIHLLLDVGSVILGASQESNAYDETEAWSINPYQDGGHCYFHNSLIWGQNLTNVSITGQGEIKGGGLVAEDILLDQMCGFATWKTGSPPPAPSDHPPVRLGNKAIALKLCRGVIIRDITIYHGGHFAILVTGCDNLTVDNVTMDTDRDGIDLDCCRNAVVSNCRVNSPNDDGICPKSSFALGRNVLTENLTITNCQVSGCQEGSLIDGTMKPRKGGTGRIKFGTEASGGFRNCAVSNCTFRGCKGLALEEVDGGVMENITVTNLTMMDVQTYAIYITTGSRDRGGDVRGPSVCRNILISNVIADGVEKMQGIQITGIPGHPLEGIRLDNIRLVSEGGATAEEAAKPVEELRKNYPEPRHTLPAYGIYARHVNGLELANITTSFTQADPRPAAIFTDVTGLEIDNFKPQVADGVSAAVFSPDVVQPVIRNSPALK